MRRFLIGLGALALANGADGQAIKSTVGVDMGAASQTEIVFWQSIQSSNNPEDLRAYIAKYPNGSFVALARNRIAILHTGAGTAAPPSVSGAAPMASSGGSPNGSSGDRKLGEAGRIYVYPGQIIWPGGSKAGMEVGSFEITVDGSAPERLKKGHFLTFNLSPGPHQILRWQRTVWGPMHPIKANVSLQSGQTIYVAVNHYQGMSPNSAALGGLFGAVGGLAVGIMEASNGANGHPPGDYLEESPSGSEDILNLKPANPR